MFLPVTQARCSGVLNRIMDMVQVILDYSIQSLVQELDFEQLTKLVDKGLHPLLKKKVIRRNIEQLFQLTYVECTEVNWAFVHDRDFVNHIDDKGYCLHFCFKTKDQNQKPLEVLNRLCNDLYDNISKGLPGNEAAFSTLILQSDYEEVNGEYGLVCPVCMKENLFGMGEGEVDHYFPRKKYPALALHPYNLLPICSDCNGSRKKHIKNPIAGSDKGPGELLTVFLPYLRSGRDEIEFRVSEDFQRRIVMEPGEKGNRYTKKRIDNMERLFQLGDRWSRVLSYVYEDIRAELSRSGICRESRKKRIVLLRRMMKTNSDSTKNRRDFIKGVYCRWLLEKSDEELEEMFFPPKK